MFLLTYFTVITLRFQHNVQTFIIYISVLELSKDPNYLKRMTMLHCINEMCDCIDVDVVEKYLLPTILELSKDRVANVRFNVAKTLSKMETHFESSSYDIKVRNFDVYQNFLYFFWILRFLFMLGETNA
jgi:hypothetical protein